ncbi:uncharacterized protein LOC144142464 isoform X3 [Haemaphysalis longicornis]
MIGLGSFTTCVLLVTLEAPTYTEGSGIVILGYGSRRSSQPTQVTPEEALARSNPFGEVDSGLPDNVPQRGRSNKPPPGPAREAGPAPKPEAVPPQSLPLVPAPGGSTAVVQPGPGGVTGGVQPSPARPSERPGLGGPGMGPAPSDFGGDFAGPSPFSPGGPGANVFSEFEFGGFRGRRPSGGRLPGLSSGVGPGPAPAGVQPGPMPAGPGGAVGPSMQPSIGGRVPNGEGGVRGEPTLPGGAPGGRGAFPSPEGPAPGPGPAGGIPTGGNENGGGGRGISVQPSRPSSGSNAGLPVGRIPGMNGGGEVERPGGSTSEGGGAGSRNQPDILSDPDFKEFEREMNDHIRESEDGLTRTGGPRENGGTILGGMPGAFGREGGMTGGISVGSPGSSPEGPGGGASEVAGRSGWGDFNFGGLGGGGIPSGFGGFSTGGGEFGSGFGGGASRETTGLEGPTEEGGATGGPGAPGGIGGAGEAGGPGGPGGAGGAPQPPALGPNIRGGRPPETPSPRRPSTPMGSTGRESQGTRRGGMRGGLGGGRMPMRTPIGNRGGWRVSHGGGARVLTLNRRQVRRILKEEGFNNKDIAYLLNPKLLLSTRGKGLAVVLARLTHIKRGSPFHRTRRLLAMRFIRRFLKTERGVRRVVISFRNRFRRSASPDSSSLGLL